MLNSSTTPKILNAPLLNQSLVSWKITSGEIRFYIQHHEKEADSILQLVLTLQAPHILTSISPTAIPAGYCLYWQTSDDFNATLYDIDPNKIDEDLSPWLTAGIPSLKQPPHPPQRGIISPQTGTQTCKASDIMLSQRPITWIRISQGSALFLSQATLALSRDTLFALPMDTWIECQDVVSVTIAPPASLTLCWEGIVAFQQCLLAGWQRAYQEAAQQEQQRLIKKQAQEAHAITEGMSALATVFDDPLLSKNNTHTQTALFAPCQLIAQSLGVKLASATYTPDSPLTLEAFLQRSDLRCRSVQLNVDWWLDDHGPMLAYMQEDNRPVALIMSKQGYILHDATHNTARPLCASVAKILKPEAIVYYRPLPEAGMHWRNVLGFVFSGHRKHWQILGLVWLCLSLLMLVGPYSQKILIDVVLPELNYPQLYWLIAILAAGSIGVLGSSLTRSFTQLRLLGQFNNQFQHALWDHLLKLPLSFFRQYRAGDLAVRALGVNQIAQLLSVNTLNIFIFIPFGLTYLLFIGWYSPALAWLTLSLILLFLVSVGVFAWIMLKYTRLQQRLLGALAGRVFQFFSGIDKLQATGSENKAFANWAKDYAEQQRATFRLLQFSSGLQAFNAAFPSIATILLFIISAHLFQHPGQLNMGSFLAINFAFGSLIALMRAAAVTLVSILNVIPLYERLSPILSAKAEQDASHTSPGTLSGQIELQSVSFRYQKHAPQILKDINLNIKAGEFIAIVGGSGQGKSTLLRLLLGFELPDRGEIYYDHKNLSALDLQAVRRQIGVVLQSSQLISGSLLNNITGGLAYTLDQAWEAAKLVGLDHDIESLPMGMHTHINEGASTLSTGQKQLILLARALIGKPSILFLDEATSGLDNLSQAQVTHSLKKLSATRIVIAHRLSTIRQVDRIYVLKDGKIVEQGTYDELMAKQQEFAALANNQLLH